MDILLHHLFESLCRIGMNWVTPREKRVPIPKRMIDIPTVQEPKEPYNVWPRRRGPDDYTPVNLRHVFEEEEVNVVSDWCDSVIVNKKNV